MNELDTLAANLRDLMRDRGLDNQSKLHRASGVSQAHIGNILSRRQSPGLQIIARLAKTLDVETYTLLAPRDLARFVREYDALSDEEKQTVQRMVHALVLSHSQD